MEVRHTASSRQHELPLSHSSSDHQTPSLSSTSSPVVCRQCRSRKVKCDRAEPCCGPCTRLRLTCSLGRCSASLTPERTPLNHLTQAGTKRKRSRRACQPCQLVKARCSGAYPCQRCHRKELSCNLEKLHGTSGDNESPPTSDASPHNGLPTNESCMSKQVTSVSSPNPCEKGEIKAHIDAYFRLASSSSMSLLHKPTVLATWSKGTVDLSLLELLVSIGSYTSACDIDCDATAARSLRCIQGIQDDALRHVGKQTITQLSILVMLLRFRFDTGSFAEAWNLLAIASRLVFTMRLNHEHDGLDAVTQETVRRLVWTVYDVDRKCSGGIDYLTVCPVDKMYIRLPCNDHSFEMGLKSAAPYLEQKSPGLASELSAHSCKLKLLATRDRILKYTKRIRKSGDDVSSSQSEMDALQEELRAIQQYLPSEMRVSAQNLGLLVCSSEGSRCIELHTMWLLSHCDLYRHCVPGIRESASQEALSRTPSVFIDHCQSACLDAAIQLCDFWSELYHHGSNEMPPDGMMAVAIYQVTQILHHLHHLLPSAENGDNAGISTNRNVGVLQQKLSEALEMVTPQKPTREYSWAKCVRDAKRLVTALGDIHCFPTNELSDTLDERSSQQDHMQSRHHMLAYIARDSELSAFGGNGQLGNSTDREGPQISQQRHSSTAIVSVSDEPDVMPITNDVDLMGNMSSQMMFADYGLGEFPPWDPFDMEFNGYYDSNLGVLST